MKDPRNVEKWLELNEGKCDPVSVARAKDFLERVLKNALLNHAGLTVFPVPHYAYQKMVPMVTFRLEMTDDGTGKPYQAHIEFADQLDPEFQLPGEESE